MPTTPPEPLLLLCGGLSRRMGSPKALLNYRGQSLIVRQVADALPHRTVWLAAAGSHYADTDGAVYLPDALPAHQGPLAALLPALQRAQQHGHRGLYVLACDTLLQPQAVIRVLQQAHHSAAGRWQSPPPFASTLVGQLGRTTARLFKRRRAQSDGLA